MTENRKRVSVSIIPSGRKIGAFVKRGSVARTVSVHALPIRPIDTEPYMGEYDVTPNFDGVVLATRGLRMTDDLTVDAIPFSETSNPAGGVTVHIG